LCGSRGYTASDSDEINRGTAGELAEFPQKHRVSYEMNLQLPYDQNGGPVGAWEVIGSTAEHGANARQQSRAWKNVSDK
jgi:hypothetical protein